MYSQTNSTTPGLIIWLYWSRLPFVLSLIMERLSQLMLVTPSSNASRSPRLALCKRPLAFHRGFQTLFSVIILAFHLWLSTFVLNSSYISRNISLTITVTQNSSFFSTSRLHLPLRPFIFTSLIFHFSALTWTTRAPFLCSLRSLISKFYQECFRKFQLKKVVEHPLIKKLIP